MGIAFVSMGGTELDLILKVIQSDEPEKGNRWTGPLSERSV